MGQAGSVQKPFLTDVKTLRERARKNLGDGAIGSNYVGDVNKTIEILQSVLATELVCVLRYTMHSIAASGISSESVKEEFAIHAKERARLRIRKTLPPRRSGSVSFILQPRSERAWGVGKCPQAHGSDGSPVVHGRLPHLDRHRRRTYLSVRDALTPAVQTDGRSARLA